MFQPNPDQTFAPDPKERAIDARVLEALRAKRQRERERPITRAEVRQAMRQKVGVCG